MKTTKEEYSKIAKTASPPSPKLKNLVKAFLVGGTICAVAQLFFALYVYFGVSEENSKLLVPVTIIVITAILTGIGVFDKIAKHGGAGTLVPISGFANAVVSPAIEFKNEGFILGVGANIFKIAGPVILYGTVASVIYGIIVFIKA